MERKVASANAEQQQKQQRAEARRLKTETTVLVEEAAEIHGERFTIAHEAVSRDWPAHEGFERAIHALTGEEERSALCLSGGGIRSATFSLGVLQGLARTELLERFHYLSTVSGGGYIGSWLSAWMSREPKKEGFERAVRGLAKYPEPNEIKHLRAYSNYMTPVRGLSNDALTVFGIFVRNLLLNWLVLLPLIAGAVLVPSIYLAVMSASPPPRWTGPIAVALVAAAGLLATWAIDMAWRFLPTQDSNRPVPAGAGSVGAATAKRFPALAAFAARWLGSAGERLLPVSPSSAAFSANPESVRSEAVRQSSFALGFAALLLPVAWKLVEPWNLFTIAADGRTAGALRMLFSTPEAWGGVVAYAVVFCTSVSVAGAIAAHAFPAPGVERSVPVVRLILATLGGVAFGVAIGLLLGVFAERMPGSWSSSPEFWLPVFCVAAPPLLLALHWLCSVGGIALSRTATEEAREWWARSSAVTLRLMLVWLAGTTLVLFSPLLVNAAKVSAATLITAGGVSGILSAAVGLVGSGGLEPQSAQNARWYGWIQRNFLPFCSALFLVAFLALVSTGAAEWLEHRGYAIARWPREDAWGGQVAQYKSDIAALRKATHDLRKLPPEHMGALGNCLGGDDSACGADGAFYAEVVERARTALKLGGTRSAQSTSAATLVTPERPSWVRLAITTAVLGGLAVFVSWCIGVNRFSLHSMYGNRLVRAYLGASNAARSNATARDFDPGDSVSMKSLRRGPGTRLFQVVNLALNLTDARRLAWQQRQASSFVVTPLATGSNLTGYRDSEWYGKDSDDSEGITLARAMTISGAAVSPAMGYHSSKLVSAVMTLFNTRLGWWLPNPARDAVIDQREPWLGFKYVLRELLGTTGTDSKFVHVSDGGHFDNLGLYEMVRRRCRRILLVDASQDQSFDQDDLARVIRMIRTDLGVRIDLLREIQPVTSKCKVRPHAIARIEYPERDASGNPEIGVLMVLKPCLTGGEPVDIRRYASEQARRGIRFPHESTTDQFYDEAQFESYRCLGATTVADLEQRLRDFFGTRNGLLDAPFLPEETTEDEEGKPNGHSESLNGGGGGERRSPAKRDFGWVRTLMQGSSAWVAPAVVSGVAAATLTTITVGVLEPSESLQNLSMSVSASPELASSLQQGVGPSPALLAALARQIEPSPRLSSAIEQGIGPDEELKEGVRPHPELRDLKLGVEEPQWVEDGIGQGAGWEKTNQMLAEELVRIDQLVEGLERVQAPTETLKSIDEKLRVLNDTVADIDPRRVVQGRRP